MMASLMRVSEKLGINEDDHVVLYDTVGVFSSPRGLFTFKGPSRISEYSPYRAFVTDRLAFGHEKVSILNGGLPRWIEEGNDVEMGELQDTGASEYAGKPLDKAWLRCELPEISRTGIFSLIGIAYEQMVKNSEKRDGEVVLDHRPLPR